MFLTGDLFSSEKSIGKKMKTAIFSRLSQIWAKWKCVSWSFWRSWLRPFHNGARWRMDDICPESKINTIIIIITVSLFAAPKNECHNWGGVVRAIIRSWPWKHVPDLLKRKKRGHFIWKKFILLKQNKSMNLTLSYHLWKGTVEFLLCE